MSEAISCACARVNVCVVEISRTRGIIYISRARGIVCKVHHELNASCLRSYYVRVSVSVIWCAVWYFILFAHTNLHDYAYDYLHVHWTCQCGHDACLLSHTLLLTYTPPARTHTHTHTYTHAHTHAYTHTHRWGVWRNGAEAQSWASTARTWITPRPAAPLRRYPPYHILTLILGLIGVQTFAHFAYSYHIRKNGF